MNVDTPRQGSPSQASPSQGQGSSGRSLLILLLLAFVGGAVLSGWIITRSGWFDTQAPPQAAVDRNVITAAPASPAPAPIPPSMATGMLSGPVPPGALDQRVAELENRLSLINVQAQAASGNAGRAEGLLIAFAARRALDRASALGYLEGQLQLRFGTAQPNAVATIIRASKNPVTMDQLRAQLDEIGPSLGSGRAANESFWAALHREASELFVIEQAGKESQTPTQRVQRARRYLEAGRVEAALGEIEKLPGRAKAADWIAKARSYAEARRALDIIESAAILEPRGLRDATGQPIEQPSPLAPPAG